MPIQTVIRSRRKQLGLTQEQVADSLGVTAPAVNKWEKGVTCPDVALLPALARLLGVDLNTLLCFQEDLSELELRHFLQAMGEAMRKDGFAAGLSMAREKIKAFPTCAKLIYQAAMMLDGAQIMLCGGSNGPQAEEPEIIALYQRAAESGDAEIRCSASFLLAAKYLGQGAYAQAQEMLDRVPAPSAMGRGKLQADLYLAQGKLEQAAKLLERQLMQDTNAMQALLLSLALIAQREGRDQDADELAERSRAYARLMGQWDYMGCLCALDLAAERKDASACLAQLEVFLNTAKEPWDIKATPLYRHIAADYPQQETPSVILPPLLTALETDPKYAFLRDEDGFRQLLRRYRAN